MESIAGVARVDRRTKNLIPRLRPGEIAIIDHRDLDALSASGLLERKPAAIVNASPSISGRYPNRGPSILVEAGLPLLDVTDPGFMTAVADGQKVTLTSEGIQTRAETFRGVWLTPAFVDGALEDARNLLGVEIEAFARNTLEYIERERHLVLETPDLPELKTNLANRHAVVVVRGDGFKRDLQAILPYVRDLQPVLIAVDGAADALLEQGLKPHLIVGDMDSVSDQALRCGAEIVVHSYPRRRSAARRCMLVAVGGSDGHALEEASPSEAEEESDPEIQAPGLKRLRELGIEGKVFSVAGTSEDMAMLIAYEKGAELIVAVGTHFGLIDFLDKGRAGMASTFLVRLRVGSKLVDARGVGALYSKPGGYGWAGGLVAAAMAPLLAIALLSPGVQLYLRFSWTLFLHWLRKHGIG